MDKANLAARRRPVVTNATLRKPRAGRRRRLNRPLTTLLKLTRPRKMDLVDPTIKTVPSPFTWDELDLQMSKGEETFSAAASTKFTLTSPTGLAAPLALAVEYHNVNKEWDVSGYALGLSGALLADFFDPDYKDALLQVIGHLSIPSIVLM